MPLRKGLSPSMWSTAADRDRLAQAAGCRVGIRAAVVALRIAVVLAVLAAATTQPVAAGTQGGASRPDPSTIPLAICCYRAVTDGAGAVVRLEQTDEFGVPTATAGTRTQPFGFTGEQVDPSSGLVDLRARLYDPPSGRFLTRDGFPGHADLPLSLNRYSYVLNDPATLTDPSGEVPILPVAVCGAGAAAGLVLGGVGSGEKLTGSRVLRDAGAGCLAGLSILAGGGLAVGLTARAAVPTSAYLAKNAAGDVIYVGITTNFARRAAEHFRHSGLRIRTIPGLNKLSPADARAVEQALIGQHGLGRNGGTLVNKINSISPRNPSYPRQLRRGLELLERARYPR